ncbi:hypothetical protein GCM10007913_42260 [Devosia yakushimensis]|uniref:Tetratricopeptide repeat protein n=1 Tax=Devosia yakushimensis TaxID=470028 RepID=A0ABQ5UJS4_9HYPH|nr:tetratricopeptide repeat protein [Devosia yakushimensis]GLQ12293.1 hypothetical protein GCM10007913_42260 [Devosia yakushimensis]
MRGRILVIVLAVLSAPARAIDISTGDTLDDARRLVEGEKWLSAQMVLQRLVTADPDDADSLNLLAYTLRHTGDLAGAERFYLRALAIEPGHLGANEYLGELYIETGARDKAADRLAVIETVCGLDCEEYRELKAALDAAP